MSEAARTIPQELGQARERFLHLVSEVRPELHRYCARLTGSVVDGEDIVQEALARAFYALSLSTDVPPLRPWLFRVAHNTSIDYLRRYERRHVEARADFDDVGFADDAVDPAVVRAGIAAFLELPVVQRSAVVLKDVLGHSLEETAETMSTTVPAVKAALVRGRAGLREARARSAAPVAANDGDLAAASDDEDELAASAGGARRDRRRAASAGDGAERERLQRYVALFNARDWDGLRALMAEECRLDLVAKAARRGKEVHGYFARYDALPDARVALGAVEGRPALLVYTEKDQARPAYFIFIEWSGERVAFIRDYRYVDYVAREAQMEIAPPEPALAGR